MKVIKINKLDGTTATIYPVWKTKMKTETDDEFLERIRIKAVKNTDLKNLQHSIETVESKAIGG